MIALSQKGRAPAVAKPSGSATADGEIVHDAAMHELVVRMVRLGREKVAHRLISRFELVNGQLGVSISLERKHRGRWECLRPETWIPLVESTASIYGLLLHVAEHGRLPDSVNQPEGATLSSRLSKVEQAIIETA
ncbi:MAG: hypothetical protein WD771_08780 [Gemmatimonadaceae bacterium]